jgi:hypothetical protein
MELTNKQVRLDHPRIVALFHDKDVLQTVYSLALSDMSGYARSIKVSYTLSEAYNLGYTQGKLNLGVIDAVTAWENAIKKNSYLDKKIPKEIAFFTCSDCEDHLIYTEPDEAIENFLEGLFEPDSHGIEGLPKTITLYGFEPMKVIPSRCNPLECLLDDLDEEYGNPDGDRPAASSKMKDAEKAFIEAVVAEYRPWAHERTWECEVDVEAWVWDNMPEWIDE